MVWNDYVIVDMGGIVVDKRGGKCGKSYNQTSDKKVMQELEGK